VIWEEEALADAVEVDRAANGMGRGDGWDATLWRLGERGRTYAPGGIGYMVTWAQVPEYSFSRCAWARTEAEGRSLLHAPPSMGWVAGEDDEEGSA
jgi:hypothetical protein